MLDIWNWYNTMTGPVYLIFICIYSWNSIKESGDTNHLSNILFEVFSTGEIENNLRLLNEIFQASNEPEWIEYLQELVIDIIWTLGNH